MRTSERSPAGLRRVGRSPWHRSAAPLRIRGGLRICGGRLAAARCRVAGKATAPHRRIVRRRVRRRRRRHGCDRACHAQIRQRRGEFLCYDGGHLPFDDETFDIVTSFQVIEHVEDVHGYMGEIRECSSRPACSLLPRRIVCVDSTLVSGRGTGITCANTRPSTCTTRSPGCSRTSRSSGCEGRPRWKSSSGSVWSELDDSRASTSSVSASCFPTASIPGAVGPARRAPRWRRVVGFTVADVHLTRTVERMLRSVRGCGRRLP